ncbi:hypothetical protein [Streptomyces griseus]|uniref:hypothetical protein n=1 Tax=Streptomyces griseus TaxID=1911 RepID=UPI0005687CD0|nr:hypothetical protein [Streptomyces griseus]
MSLPALSGPRAFAELTVYRWSELSLTGGNGVGPVATSLSDADLGRWDRRLAPLVWAVQGSIRPGYMYLTYDDEAAVLRKVSVQDAHGRSGSTLTHVLTGPAADLDLALALTLCRSGWNWLPPGGLDGSQSHLPPVPLDRLRPHLESDAAGLEKAAAEVPEALLAPVAAAVLSAPEEPVTVVGSRVPAEVVIQALSAVLGPLTAGEWTFATSEESDSAPGLPRFVFLERERGPLHQGNRRLVRADVVEDLGAADASVDRAAHLVRLHRRRGPEAIARLRPPQPLRTGREARAWQDEHQTATGMVVDVAGMLLDAVGGRLESDEIAFLRRPASVPQVETHLRRLKPQELETLVRNWSPHRQDLNGLALVRDTLHTEVLRRVLRARTDPGSHTDAETGPGLVSALRSALPRGDLMRERLDHELELARRKGLNVDVLGVLLVARSAGLPEGDLVEEVRRLALSELPLEILLAQVDRITATDPSLGRELLHVCFRRRSRRDNRYRIAAVLGDQRFLANAVRVMSDGQPGLAVKYYQWLLYCLTGSQTIQRRDVHEVLGLAGHPPPAALLSALRRNGAKNAVQSVDAIAASEYFRQNLSARQRPSDPMHHSSTPTARPDPSHPDEPDHRHG